MKRRISVAIAACLTLAIAGCSSGNNEKNGAANVTPAQESVSPSATATAEANPYKDKLDIDITAIYYSGGGWADDHPIIKLLEDKFNIDLNMQWIPSDTYSEKVNVMAASGSLPDSMFLNGADYKKWVEKGLFLDLKPLLSNYPNLSQYLGDEEDWQYMNPSGKYYGLPYSLTETRNAYGIRKDWLDKLNLEMPKTIDEFYEVAKAFALQDPDGNGKNDTIGFSAALPPNQTEFRQMDPILAAFGLVDRWGIKDSKLIPWQTQVEEWKDVAAFMNKAYEEGVLDKDFAINKVAEGQDKYMSGKLGILDMPATDVYNKLIPNLEKIVPTAETAQLAPPIGPTGLQGGNTLGKSNQRTIINAKIDPAKQKRILAMYDYLLSDEGYTMIKNGVEGIHYKKEGDSYVKLPAFEEDHPSQIVAGLLHRVDPLSSVRLFDDQETAAKLSEWYANNEPYKWPNASDGLKSETNDKLGVQLAQKFTSVIVKVIMGQESLDAIDDASKQWLKDGGDKIIEEMNAAYQASH
ncbi:extracellular solute-binding protein [Paenibacillus sp. HB172176]|uniref:extracellular solute-binding protein n=1 Tax=Paenibacillus sp. HB172176 TaxID=2493690 RepID=UPI00143C95A6|nr:extracellular solute-binding protein [Paenibacillus sp. HB172176]